MNVLALCSGANGLELGLSLAEPSTRTVCYVEGEAYVVAATIARIQEKILDEAPIWDNVRTFDGKPWRGRVHCITGGYPCFAAGTLILTRDGYLPIESVRVGDEVLTHLGRWRRVTATMSRENAKLRRLVGGGVPGVITTDEHPFFARKLGRKWDNDRRCYVRKFAPAEWTEAGELQPSGCFLAQTLPPVGSDSHSEALWWLVGRYVADGWRQARPSRGNGKRKARKPGGRVNICCAFEETDELRERIRSAGFHAFESKERTASRFAITNSSFYRFLKPFGKGAGGKRVPGFVLELDCFRAKAFLEGYLSGD